MDPLDFLRIAKKLLNYDSEANWRTSISRSYYAIYNYLKQECAKLGVEISKGPSGHGDLIRCLRGSELPDAVDIGSKVNDLHSHRIKADYDMAEPITLNTAKLFYRKAEKIKDGFPAIDPAGLKAGIDKYKTTLNEGR